MDENLLRAFDDPWYGFRARLQKRRPERRRRHPRGRGPLTARFLPGLSLALLGLCFGCGSTTTREFLVTSFPEQAYIVVNGKVDGGLTPKKLVLKLQNGELATIRVEKKGFQPAGTVVGPQSPDTVALFLQEANQDTQLLQVLGEIRQQLGQIHAELKRLAVERASEEKKD